MAIAYLDTAAMEKMCHRLAMEHFDAPDDPIPPFADHNTQLLESALNLPRATFDGHDLYPALTDKAAILYYALIKNHAFPNGNKRLATAALLIFLFINAHWLKVSDKALAEMTIRIAESHSQEKDTLLEEVKKWVKDNLVAA